MIADADARRRALDPRTSFVVQAPAGSGKTSLLTQRFLRLLCTVAQPEEVVAITFTRKAAAEMRHRLLAALARAHGPEPESEYERDTYQLARAVLAHQARLGWELEKHPGRLRLGTIDSLCASLVRQMPYLSGLGVTPGVSERPEELYREAAAETLAAVEEASPLGDAVRTLLGHLDNDLSRAENLLAELLPQREQWLRHCFLSREELEDALRRLVTEQLEQAAELIGWEGWRELALLAHYAANNLDPAEPHDLLAWRERTAPPAAQPEDLALWKGACRILLTSGGGWRKSLTKTVGFPSGSNKQDKAEKAEWKRRAEELIASLSDDLPELLDEIGRLPDWRYGDGQWQALQALLAMLPAAVARLRLSFARHGEVDFSEIAQRAGLALGTPQQPTDLMLTLDARLQHLLVDEFQDTSLLQKRLLEQLTADWDEGDGRTLFLVGDPMQSIYRFRAAEVRIFLEAREGRLGNVRLEPLTLTVNFRCQGALVGWYNQTFGGAFPQRQDLIHGGVPYTPADAARPTLDGPAVQHHILEAQPGLPGTEAQVLADMLQELQRHQPEATAAVLVRSRPHLIELVAELRSRGLRFQAVELEGLSQRPVVQDLHALTRALLHLGDRAAWLACLRAPWSGLTLADIYTLCSGAPTVWEGIEDEERRAALPADSRARLERCRLAWGRALAEAGRASLRFWVEECWLALGGAAACQGAGDLEAVEMTFSLLDNLDRGGELRDLDDLEAALARLYAPADPAADGKLQLMTMHKSKGLEFDVVLLPGLGRRPRGEDPRLISWMERPRSDGDPERDSDLLLAPIRATIEESDSTYQLFTRYNKRRERHEDARLLYVAATRARQRLHLVATLKRSKDGSAWAAPDGGSLLARIWEHVADQVAPPEPLPEWEGEGDAEADELSLSQALAPRPELPPVPLQRLPADYRPPLPQWQEPEQPGAAPVRFPLSRQQTVATVRRALEALAAEGVEAWSSQRLEETTERWLRGAFVLDDAARERVRTAVRSCLSDPRARWVLSGLHQACAQGVTLRGPRGGRVRESRLDRTFVADGERWLIAFALDEELEGVRQRLAAASALAGTVTEWSGTPLRHAAWSPLDGVWVEWSGEQLQAKPEAHELVAGG